MSPICEEEACSVPTHDDASPANEANGLSEDRRCDAEAEAEAEKLAIDRGTQINQGVYQNMFFSTFTNSFNLIPVVYKSTEGNEEEEKEKESDYEIESRSAIDTRRSDRSSRRRRRRRKAANSLSKFSCTDVEVQPSTSNDRRMRPTLPLELATPPPKRKQKSIMYY